MAKTRGAHSFRPQVRQSPTAPAIGPSAAVAGPGLSVPPARPTDALASPAPAAGDAESSSSVAPTQRRYHTRVGPTPPAPSHPRPARSAPPAKRVPPSPPYQGIAGTPDQSPGSIIRRPYFPYDPIPGNVSCRERDFHGEVYYDLPAFA